MILAGPIAFEQNQYRKAHDQGLSSILKRAVATRTELEPGNIALAFCTKEHCSVRGVIMVYYFVVFLWISRMMQELSELLWLLIAIWNVPLLDIDESGSGSGHWCTPCARPSPSDSGSSEEEDTEDVELQAKSHRRARVSTIEPISMPTNGHARKATQWEDAVSRNEDVHITRLHPVARTMMLGTVGLLRFTTYIMVQWVGIKFLVMSTSTISMIIKSLAFQYIIGIPDLLFNASASDAMRARVKRTQLYFTRPALKHWDDWLSSVVRLSVMFLGTLAVFQTSNSGFHSIMRMRYDCQEYARIWGTTQGHGRDWEMLLEDLRSVWDSKSYF
jgi:hypothetical protein